jgi:hypothetical protein
MGWFQAAKCRIGLHDWAAWSDKKPDCSASRHCRACPATGEEKIHDWSDWKYNSKRTCFQSRKCTDCGERENSSGEVHAWLDWKYLNDRSCEERMTCGNCGETQSREIHAWGVWENESPGSDRLIRFCRRCAVASPVKDPVPIICAAEDDDRIVRNMRLYCPLFRDAARLRKVAASLGESRDIQVEIGHQPRSPRSGRKYLTWGWNTSRDHYDILIWDGEDWERQRE